MKKIKLLAFASLMAGGLNAQYFQHVYGAHQEDFLESGVNASPTMPQGHVMTGYTDNPGNITLQVTYTDLDGRFVSPPFFNNVYPINTSVGNLVDARGRRVIQPAQAGGRILVWGDYDENIGGVSTKFFYTVINSNGTPTGVVASYNLPFPVVEAEATSITYSTTRPNTVFACGYVRIVTGGQRYPIIMSIDATTGVIIWSGMYQIQSADWAAMDLVESPYVTGSGIPDIALTGHYVRPGGLNLCGCFWLVSTATGAMTSPVVEYGLPLSGNAGVFNAIDIANNPFGSGAGFVLGGYYDNPGSGTNDMWAMKVSPNGMTVDFSTLIDYSIPGMQDYGNDIIERLNTGGNYEYYIGGYVVTPSSFLGEEMLVQKLDFSGMPFIGLSQFTYGGNLGDERAAQLDQYNGLGTNNDGLSVFGTTINSFPALAFHDFYLVKSYFNGPTACNFDLQAPPSMPGPQLAEWWNATIPDQLKKKDMLISFSPMLDWEICWSSSVTGGSNARLAAATTLELPGYFPNPVSRENGLVTVSFGKETVAGVAQVELRNALGQVCWSKQVTVADGQTNMQVELGNTLNAGMYHLIINQGNTMNNYRIMVQ